MVFDPDSSQPLKPMLCHPKPRDLSIDEIAKAGGWIAEEKYNGARVVFKVDGDLVNAWSRPQPGHQIGKCRLLPDDVRKDAAFLPDGVYDAELYVVGGTSTDVVRKTGAKRLMLFDVLCMYGAWRLDEAYALRRIRLEEAGERQKENRTSTECNRVSVVAQVPVSQATVDAIWARGGEGIVLKREDSIYKPGTRTREWLKVKQRLSEVFIVVGFKPGKNGPNSVLVLEHLDGHANVKAPGWLVEQANADPEPFIARRVQIEYSRRNHSGAYVEPIFDRFVEDER